jgi:hypothetical protein
MPPGPWTTAILAEKWDDRSDGRQYCYVLREPGREILRRTRSANHLLDGAHYLPEASPPASTVRAKRALRSAPVVLVRGVRMPASAKTGGSVG